MNKYLSNILMLAVLLLTGIALTSCTHSDDSVPEPEPFGPKTYTLTIKASKSPDTALTRALSDNGTKISSTWATTEAIYVKKCGSSTWATGTLSPKEAGSNVDCSGTVTFSETITTSDQLTLLFPRSTIDYTGQVGTLADIAAKYDYATATTDVTNVSGSTITAANTTLENQQAIVKFTLTDKSTNEPINANSLTISASGLKTSDTETGDITITPTTPTNVIYAALSGIISTSDNHVTVTVTATTDAGTYVYEKPDVTFSNGQYYAVNLKMVKSCTTPLTFEWFDDDNGYVTISNYHSGYLWYKVGNDEWTRCNEDNTSISLTKNQTVIFRGDNATSNGENYTQIYTNGKCYVYGNIMSLVKGATLDSDNKMVEKDFSAARTLEYEHTFDQLFCYGENSQNIYSHDTKVLVLPATSLKPYCYNMMFEGCSNLVRAPELPASIIPNYAYNEMFFNCTNLNYIKCLATNISATDCTNNWVYNVAESGTFVVNSTLTITGESPTYKTVWGEYRGDSGIPEGWTVTN